MDRWTLLFFILYLQGKRSLRSDVSVRHSEPLLDRMRGRAGQEFERWIRIGLRDVGFTCSDRPVEVRYEYDVIGINEVKKTIILADAKYRDINPSSLTSENLIRQELTADGALLDEAARQQDRLEYFRANPELFEEFIKPERAWREYAVLSFVVTKHVPLISKYKETSVLRAQEFSQSVNPAMTDVLCYADSYLREFDATVVETTPRGVVLDRTAFYPGGGGQPNDTGELRAGPDSWRVKKLSRDGSRIVHELESLDLSEGTGVRGVIDWEHRYRLMRTHTALHILCGIVWRDFGAQVTGGDMKPLAARMDFELEQMSADFAAEMESKVNAEIEAARDVEVGDLSREDAFANPNLIRTKINLLPPAIKRVRTVDIVGLDLQADGGTHVANTSEVGRVRVVGHESKGRINKRLRIEVVP